MRRLFVRVGTTLLGWLAMTTTVSAQVRINDDTGLTFGLGTADLESTVISVVQWVLGFLGLIAFLAILVSIIVAATSSSDDRKEIAKKALIGSIVGLIVILMAWAVVTFVIGTTTTLTE